jgi:hypothetical protein
LRFIVLFLPWATARARVASGSRRQPAARAPGILFREELDGHPAEIGARNIWSVPWISTRSTLPPSGRIETGLV